MRIAVLSTSFTQGGAAIVTQRLVDALRALGNDVFTFQVEGRRERRPEFLAERGEIFLTNGFSRRNLFKVSTASTGRRGLVSEILGRQPEIIVMGWINHGLLSLRQLRELGASEIPIVWIMHDMWPMTGICHHSLGCRRFEDECGFCPLISGLLRGRSDLSHRVWKRKRKAYDAVTDLTFVAVSRWLGEMAAKSMLLGKRDCRVIPNVFPVDDYRIGAKERGLIIFGAARLDDPIKGLDYAIASLNRVNPETGAHVAFFGEIRNPELLSRLKMPYQHLGPLKGREVADLCSRAEVILSTSLFETLPTTLIEGQASGAVPVSFNRGGQADIIEPLSTGWLAEFGNVDSIARGIEWALSGAVEPQKLREAVEKNFSAEKVAEEYLKLFEELRAEG